MTYRIALALVLAWLGWAAPGRAAEPLVAEAIVSAPVATVWQAFATAGGYESVGVAGVTVDLKIGGLLRVPAQESSSVTTSEILSFEPQRLLSTRVTQPPAAFGDAAAFAGTWSVIYFVPLGAEMTQVRIAGFGFSTPALAKFFEQDHAAQLRRVEKHYWPLCALCKTEGG